MAQTLKHQSDRYDFAAPKWGDKMRSLGYYDGYLKFLSAGKQEVKDNVRIIDVGAGTASFAQAWIGVNGVPLELTLLDPSQEMLNRGRAALRQYEIEPVLVQALLGEIDLEPADEVLAAHVIEHCADP